MSITSNLFLTVFLPIIFLFVILSRKYLKRQNVFLLVSNVVFLLFNGVGGILLLFATCIVDYLTIRFISKRRLSKVATVAFTVALIINITPLLFFKYTGFLFSTINNVFDIGIIIPQLYVPIGISFYTFQAISLLSDVKTGKVHYCPRLFDVCFYLSFFTTITSGPIVRFSDIQTQIQNREICGSRINSGLTRFVIGLAKKVLLANNLAIYVDSIYRNSELGESFSVLAYWTGAIAFSLQLYLDFSGYSDMAIGISEVLGFHIPENFNYPYSARTIGEFWRKWHISLSQWFRDYVYIPLGGNRVSIPRHIFNLFAVWCLTGIWHGANWTFIVWGLLYFVLLVIEKYIKPLGTFLNKHFIGHIYTLFFVNLLWVFFKSSSIQDAWVYISRMFGFGSISHPIENTSLHIIPFLIISSLCCYPIVKWIKKYEDNRVIKIIKPITLCLLLVLSLFSIASASFTPFIYGNF